MILKTYIKHYPAEYHSQSAIEAVLTLRQQWFDAVGYSLSAEAILSEVQSINIQSFDAAVDIIAGFPEHWAPTSRETADHSMPYCVCVALLDGDVTLDSFAQSRIQEPVIRQLLQTVTVHRNAEMTAGYPDGIPNQITITLNNGSVLQTLSRYPLGHAHNPMPWPEVQAKYRKLCQTYFTESAMEIQLSQTTGLENCTDLRSWLTCFQLKA
jgi:2-methylcitrate dehydratase